MAPKNETLGQAKQRHKLELRVRVVLPPPTSHLSIHAITT